MIYERTETHVNPLALVGFGMAFVFFLQLQIQSDIATGLLGQIHV